MDKPKKHRWVTEAINAGDRVLSVWPSKEELASKEKMKKFYDALEKINEDPRVLTVRRMDHPEYTVVFLFDIDNG